jgi:hypothetical protein
MLTIEEATAESERYLKMYEFEQLDMAYGEDTSAQILVELSKHVWWNVRCAVAGNANTPVEILMELCKDEDEDVRAVANANPKLLDILLT